MYKSRRKQLQRVCTGYDQAWIGSVLDGSVRQLSGEGYPHFFLHFKQEEVCFFPIDGSVRQQSGEGYPHFFLHFKQEEV